MGWGEKVGNQNSSCGKSKQFKENQIVVEKSTKGVASNTWESERCKEGGEINASSLVTLVASGHPALQTPHPVGHPPHHGMQLGHFEAWTGRQNRSHPVKIGYCMEAR